MKAVLVNQTEEGHGEDHADDEDAGDADADAAHEQSVP